MRRIAIVGNCGTGKSTLARQLAAKLELTHIELDALFHQPGWSPTPAAEFVAKLNEALANADATTADPLPSNNSRAFELPVDDDVDDDDDDDHGGNNGNGKKDDD